MDRSGALIIWRGADAIGLSPDFAQEIFDNFTMDGAGAECLFNGDIIPARADLEFINGLWADAHGAEDDDEE